MSFLSRDKGDINRGYFIELSPIGESTCHEDIIVKSPFVGYTCDRLQKYRTLIRNGRIDYVLRSKLCPNSGRLR